MKTLITRIKRLALALCFVTPLVSWAAEPVAVWDGDFTATQTGYTLNLNGNSLSDDNSVVTIDQESSGIDINFDADMKSTGVTLLVKYSNFVYGEKSKVIATQCNGGTNYSNDRTGVDLQADNTLWGMWYHNGWADNGSKSAAGVFPSSGTYAFTYKNNGGTYLYASSEAFSTPTSVWGASGLKAGTDSLWGVTVGGMRSGTVNTNWRAAQGAKISGIAVFEGVLTMAQVNEYRWPTDGVIDVSADTTVSAINTQIGNLAATVSRVFIDVADGVQIDVDEAFTTALPIKVVSEGTVTLSAAEQPDLSGVTFDVKGALLRTWLTNLVRGFNFTNDSGGDTSGALAEGTWASVANSANGSSTALFADGLSTLTWASANTWSAGSGSILSGYLDDGALNGNGAEVRLSNVPYETYDVIIYCNSDSNPGNFLAKTVNGTTYTWNSTTASVVEGNSVWGKAALATPVYGVNALRIRNLTGALTIYGTPRNGSQRGGIAAIQIMPPETPDNIRTYKLTLDGTDTTWTNGAWTLNDQSVEAPTAGYVEVVASASTVVTVDTAVSVASLTINGSEDVVVSIVTDGEEGSSFSTIGATVAGGVFKQGVANSVTGLVTVENGGTFDMNGLANGAALVIAGAGAGSWPWALGSSSGEVQLSTPPTLTGDAAIGGAGKIVLGVSQSATAFPLGGFTLTKSGAGELYCYNVRTDNGTLDVAGGTLSFNQWTALDGSETIDRHTTVIVRNGAELKNNAGRRLWIDTLNVEAGATVTTTANGYFGVSAAFSGTCDTTKLQFNDGAVATLDGNLTVAKLVAQGDNDNTAVGSMELALATGTSAATVTVSDTVTAVGTIAVGAGVTPAFTGEGDVTATLSYAADPSPTANTALAFTQESNWKGTVVLDYAITGASGGSVFQPGKYGNANSTVCLGQGASNIFLSVRGSTNPGNIDTKLYLKGNLSLKNGWADENQKTTIPQLGADEGVTFTTRVGGNKVTYFDITALKDFAGTIALSDYTDVKIGNVVLDELPEKGALVVKATTGTGNNKGTISGSVTVAEETVQLVYGTVGEETGLLRPTTVTVTVPVVENTTVAVTVGGTPTAPDTEGGNVYTVDAGSAVVVTYTGADGYKVNNGTFNITANEDTTVDTSTVVVSEYVAWIYDVNGDLVGNPYTMQMSAVIAFSNGTGYSVKFKTALEAQYHDALIAGCSYDETTITYTRLPPVAAVVTTNGEVEYVSLQTAVNDANGFTVKLLDDVDVVSTGLTFPADKTITFDLNGYTLTAGNGATSHVQVNGVVTITDSSEGAEGQIVSGENGTYGLVQVAESKTQEGAALTIAGGTIEAYFPDALNGDNQHPAYGVVIKGKDTVFNMTGGKVKAGLMAVMGHGSKATAGTYTISGGTIESVDDFAMYLPTKSGCSVTISGGTFVGKGGVCVRAGTLNVTGGTFTASGTGIAPGASSGTTGASFAGLSVWPNYGAVEVTVSGGTFTSATGVDAVVSTASSYAAAVSLTGGTYSTDVTDFCANGYLAELQEDVYVVRQANYIVEVNGVPAETLDGAFAADGTVKLLADVDVVSTGLTFPAGKTITFDLNGKTLTAGNGATSHVQVNGVVTITDSSEGAEGQIVSGEIGTYGLVQVAETKTQEGAALTIAGGTIEAYFPDALNGDNQHPAYGVVIKGKDTVFNMTGGKVKAGLMAVMGHGSKATAGTYTISGGTIESVDDFAMYLPTKSGCSVTISGGTFVGKGGVCVRAGTLNVTGGTFTASGTGIAPGASSGTTGASFAGLSVWPNYGAVEVTVSGGTFTSATGVDAVVSTASSYAAAISLTGGTYSTDPSDYVADGYAATESAGVWTVAEVQDVPVEPGESTEPVDTAEEAQAIAEKTVVSVPDAVADELTPAQESAYAELFEAKVVEVPGETTKYAVEVVLKQEVVTEIQTVVDAEAEDLAKAAVDAAADAVAGGEATVTTKPGLYYVVEAGTEPDGIAPASCTLATSESTALPVPNKGAKGFYKIRVSVTPVDVQ